MFFPGNVAIPRSRRVQREHSSMHCTIACSMRMIRVIYQHTTHVTWQWFIRCFSSRLSCFLLDCGASFFVDRPPLPARWLDRLVAAPPLARRRSLWFSIIICCRPWAAFVDRPPPQIRSVDRGVARCRSCYYSCFAIYLTMCTNVCSNHTKNKTKKHARTRTGYEIGSAAESKLATISNVLWQEDGCTNALIHS